MSEILTGTIVISILHAVIPSHWIPLVTFAKLQKWSDKETMLVSFYLAVAHVLSTILLGIILGLLFFQVSQSYIIFLEWIGPIVLMISGIYFVYRHHTHHHFHIDAHMLDNTKTRKQIIYALLAYMFLSPCLEIEAFFINAGMQGWAFLGICILAYMTISIVGMVCWVYVSIHGLKLVHTHRMEHYAGIITGITMILSGLLGLLVHHH